MPSFNMSCQILLTLDLLKIYRQNLELHSRTTVSFINDQATEGVFRSFMIEPPGVSFIETILVNPTDSINIYFPLIIAVMIPFCPKGPICI